MKKIFYLLAILMSFHSLELNGQIIFPCPNLVTNGNFETTNANFIYGLPLNAGCAFNTYSITTRFNLKCAALPNFGDHTSGSGKFLVIQGSNTATDIWKTNVTVAPNNSYTFSFWVSGATATTASEGLNIANLAMVVNNGVVPLSIATANNVGWVKYTYSGITPPGITNLSIAIRQTNSGLGGSDYGIDDISFESCLAACDANFTFSALNACGAYQFTNTSISQPESSVSWNFGDPASGANNTSNIYSPTHQFSGCGSYNVCLIFNSTICRDTICKNIVVSETTPPVITCPANKTVNCLTDTIPSVTGTATATDNCPNVTVSHSDAIVGTLCDGGFIQRTWIAKDACGNKVSCVQTIFVVYNQPVITCPANVSVTASQSACQAVVPNIKWLAVGGNCLTKTIKYTITGATTASGNDDASGKTFNAGVSTVTYTVTDACNRVSSCSFTVTVSCGGVETCTACIGGIASPNLVSNGSFTNGSTGFTSQLSGPSTNCSTGSYGIATNFSTFCSGWQNLGANSAPNFLVLDGSTAAGPTVLWQSPVAITTNTDYNFSFYWALGFSHPNQNFPITVDIVNAAGVPVAGVPSLGTQTIATNLTWTNACLSWNSGALPTGNYYVAIRQTTGSLWRDWGIDDICFTKKLPVTCNAEFTSAAVGACGNFQFTNTSTPTTGLTYSWSFGDGTSSTAQSPTHQFNACGTYNVCLTITGTSCNSTICHTVTYSDAVLPTITCPAAISVSCSADTIPSVTGLATATDNCGTPTLSYVNTQSGTFLCNGTIRRTWTARDGCGNTSSCFQIITVADKTPPTITCPANISVSCITDTTTAKTGTATATDNCTGTVSLTYTQTVLGINPTPCDLLYGRTWTAKDGCSNTSTCLQTIRVQDNTPPVITCRKDTIVIARDLPCSKLITGLNYLSATDNCRLEPVTYTVSGATTVASGQNDASGQTFSSGVSTVTYTAKDWCGNTSNCSFKVTVFCDTMRCVSCEGNPSSPNLIANGSFTAGNAGFSSGLNYSTTGCGTGSYGIATDFSTFCNGWGPLSPHSAPNFLALDGYNNGNVPTVLWQSAVTLAPQMDYCFSFYWAIGFAHPSQNFPISIDILDATGNIIQHVGDVTIANNLNWTNASVMWNSGNLTGNYSIAIRQLTGSLYRDWGIDDICFTKKTPCNAEFTSAALGNCGNIQFTSTSTPSTGLTYSWNFGDGSTSTAQNPTHQFDRCGTYNVCLTITGPGCNSTMCHNVVLSDNIPPIITCRADTVVIAKDLPCSKLLTGLNYLTVTDNCRLEPVTYTISGTTTVTSGQSDASGQTFNSGVSTVTYTAKDWCGNTSNCSFTVEVFCDTMTCVSCASNPSSPNLIANGNFSAGTAGFTSGLNYSGSCGTGNYAVVINFSTFCNGWGPLSPHSAPNFLALDGKDNGNVPTVLWQSPVTLSPQMEYCFSFYWAIAFAHSLQNFPISIDIVDAAGNVVANANAHLGDVTIANNLNWTNASVMWNSGNLIGNYYIAIRQLTGSLYRDWGIDDICFTKKTAPACNAEFTSAAIGSCGNFQFTNTSTPTTGVTYTWDFGGDGTSTAQNPTHQFSKCGTYDVCLMISGVGCSSKICHKVTYSDAIPPTITCPANTSVSCELAAPPSVTGTATATDNCGTPTITSTDLLLGIALPCNGIIRRTWIAKDACGNTSTCQQDITVSDKIAPTIVCPPNVVVACTTDSLPSVTGKATAFDNCNGFVNISSSDIISGTLPCGSVSRTWVARDNCGNVSNCVQTITVRDTIAPIARCKPSVGVILDANCQFKVTTAIVDNGSTDNCGIQLITVSPSVITSCGNTTVMLSVKDLCNNTSTCTMGIQTRESVLPVITCPANTSVTCTKDTVPSMTGLATATDNCGTPTITHSDVVSGNLPCDGIINRTWIAVDACGNSASCAQTILISDNVPPIITNCPASQTVNTIAGQCYYSFPTPFVITATDNCDPAPSVSGTWTDASGLVSSLTAQTQYSKGVNTVTCTARDKCGNTSRVCAFTLTVVDLEKPKITCPKNTAVVGTISPLSTVCQAIVNGLASTATDNCPMLGVNWQLSGATSGQGTNDVSNTNFMGTTTVIYTATDMAGNTATCSFTVNVRCDSCDCGSGGSLSRNLIANGNFSLGNVGFTSGLPYSNNCVGTGNRYGVDNTLAAFCSPWAATTARSQPNCLILDGSETSSSVLWQSQNPVSLTKDAVYCFSFYWTSAYPLSVQPAFPISIDIVDASGSVVASGNMGIENIGQATTGTWTNKQITWTSPLPTVSNYYVAIRQISGDRFRDFAIDDICFTKAPVSCSANFTAQANSCGKYTFNGTANGTSPYTYTWDFNDPTSASNIITGTSTTNALPIQTHQFATSGNHAVQLSITDATGCTNTYSTVVNISLPSASITGNLSICSGQSTTLTANGGGTYLWSPGGSTNASITVTPNVSSPTYTVIVTDANGCKDTAKVTITVKPLLLVEIPNQTICKGQSAILTAVNGDSYLWSTGQTSASITVTPTVTTTYTCTVTVNGCTSTGSVTVTVNPKPTVTITGNRTICQGASTALIATGGGTYAWSNGVTTATNTVTPSVTTTYTLITTAASGCKDTSLVTVAVTACGCPDNVLKNGSFELGTPSGTDESIGLATNWGRIWPAPYGRSTADFWNTGALNPTNGIGLTTPTPASQGQFAGFWCHNTTDINWREGILSSTFPIISQSSMVYNISLKLACLENSLPGASMSVYGVPTSAPTALSATNPLTGTLPLNPDLFAPAAVLLKTYPIPVGCNAAFTNINLTFNANILPASGIDRIFFTRTDAVSGKAYVALDDICLRPVDTCACGTFTDMNFRPVQGVQTSFVKCGDTLALGCNPTFNPIFGGNFQCAGNCSATPVKWELRKLSSGSVITSGTVTTSPSFTFFVLASYFASAGQYELVFTGQCGTQSCPPCKFIINVLPAGNISTNLTGYFPFNSNTNDVSPTAVNGTGTDLILATSLNGSLSAYTFNGTSSWINASTNNRGVGDKVSVCAWVRTVEKSKGMWVAGQYLGGSQPKGYLLSIGDVSNSAGSIGSASFSGRVDASNYYTAISTSTIKVNDGSWHCIVGTAGIGTSGNSEWKIYVDGVLTNTVLGATSTIAPANTPFTIGRHSDIVNIANGSMWYNGNMDDVRVYSKVLTQCEVDSLCSARIVSGVGDVIKDRMTVSIFPNPNSGTFTVELSTPIKSNMVYRITDVIGRVVMQKPFEVGHPQQTVEANSLSLGMYFLQVVSDGKVVGVEKFVKQ